MRFFNWAESFKETPTCEDILNKVRKTEITYWIFQVLWLIFTLAGFKILSETPDSDLKQRAIGLLLLLLGITHIAVMKLWAHIRLTMFFIIWDRNNRIEAEMNKLEAEDL